MTTSGESLQQAHRGRPRDAEVETRIADAVVALLTEVGYSGITIDQVAKRSGVGRPTIYRRYENRGALVDAVVTQLIDQAQQPDESGSPRERVVSHLVNTIHLLTQTPVGPIYRSMLSEVARDTELALRVNTFGRGRRRKLMQAVDAAIAAGELHFTGEVEVAVDGIVGAIYFRYLMTNRPLNRRYAEQLLAAFTVPPG